MAKPVPYIEFNDGNRAPMLGLGTAQFSFVEGKGAQSSCEGTREAVEIAVDIGYRLIDTALFYQNEAEIGQAVRNKIADGSVKREDLFISTKLWCTYMNPARVQDGLKRSLKNLQLDYVDLFLIHGPVAYEYVDESTWTPLNENGKVRLEVVDHAKMWKEMENLVDRGLTKSIGLSNFNEKQLQYILDNCRIKPANMQVECHPYLMNNDLFELCRQHGITMTGYGNIGSPARPMRSFEPDQPVLTQEPVVLKIANKYSKKPSQILIRFVVERGRIAIPRSTKRPHLEENFNIFDFVFTPEELQELMSLDKKGAIRYFPFDQYKDAPDRPF